MVSRNKRKFLSTEEFIEEYSDIGEECLDSVLKATTNVKREPSTCMLTIKTKELGLSAVDVREFSDISYSVCFSSEVRVLSIDNGVQAEEELPKTKKRRVEIDSSIDRPQGFKVMKFLQHPADVTALSYTNKNLLMSCCLDGTVKIWDRNYQQLLSFTDNTKFLSDIHASSKLDCFVTSSLSGMRCREGGLVYGASLFSFARKDPIMAFLGHTAPVQVCDTCGKAFTYKQNLTRHLKTHSGEKPFVCNICQKAFTRNSDLTRHQSIHSDGKSAHCARFHANGMYVATASWDGTVKMWNTQASGRPVRTFRDGDPGEAHRKTLAFSPDGRYLASTHSGSVRVWDLASGRLMRTLGSGVDIVCYSQSGKELAAGGTGGGLMIWNVDGTAAGSLDAELSDSHTVKQPIHRIRCTDNIFCCVSADT